MAVVMACLLRARAWRVWSFRAARVLVPCPRVLRAESTQVTRLSSLTPVRRRRWSRSTRLGVRSCQRCSPTSPTSPTTRVPACCSAVDRVLAVGGGRATRQDDQPEHLPEEQVEQPQRHGGIISDQRSPLVSDPDSTSGTPQAQRRRRPPDLGRWAAFTYNTATYATLP